MQNNENLNVKLIHCGNINIANPEDQGQKNIFFMPMGLFPIANVVKQQGFNIEIIHLDMEYNKQITDILDFDNLDLVGFDCHWINQSLVVLDVAELIKKINPMVFIFLGGYSASMFAEEIVSEYSQIDAVVRGDGELPVFELCKSFYEQKLSSVLYKQKGLYTFHDVSNLVWKDRGKICINEFSYVGTTREMNKLDFAAIDLLRNWENYRELSRYYSCISSINSEPMFQLEVGRGCDYACTFCGGNCESQRRMNNRETTSVRSIDSVVETVEKAHSMGFGTIYTCFEFKDSDEWYSEFLSRLKDYNINYGYGCWGLPSIKLIDALSGACNQVVMEISPETGDNRVRKINKDHRLYYSNNELENCLDYIAAKGNIKVQLFFGYYLVKDNEATILETIKYILNLLITYTGLVEIEYSNFSTDPGALIYFYPDKYNIKLQVRTFKDYVKNLRENYVEVKRQSPDLTLFKPNELTDYEANEIDRKVRLLNFLFYNYRDTISLMLLKTNTPDIILDILQDDRVDISNEKFFYGGDVLKALMTGCSKAGILDDNLHMTIDTEYREQKSAHRISKPTTQLYLNPGIMEPPAETATCNTLPLLNEDRNAEHEKIIIDFNL